MKFRYILLCFFYISIFIGKKNSFVENQNIFISGMTIGKNQTIKWELIKL